MEMTRMRCIPTWATIFLGGATLLSDGQSAAKVVEGDVGQERPVIQYPIAVGAERQLFVDDVVVESVRDVVRTMHPVKKYSGNPILVPEAPWETQAKSLLPLSVHRNPETGGLRVWYSAWGKQVDKPTYMCVADSTDGIRWTRPKLGLIEFNGSKENNIIREGRMFRVLYDPESRDPAQRYKAIIRDSGFFAGFSPDGLRWRTTVQVLDGAFDATSVHWDPVDRKWVASCKLMRNDKRVRGYAESKDFVHWSDIRFMLAADDRDKPGDQLYSMAVNRYESVYIGLLKVYDTTADRCDIQLAFSRNAKHWERPDRKAFLPNGPERGDWDYGNIDNLNQAIRMGDELWFFYSGRSTLHNEKPNDGAMGLGTLRLDGFVSMNGGPEVGELITRPVVLKGTRLYVNASAKGGEVRVELLPVDSQGQPEPIAPFTKGNCVLVTADSIRHEVKWKGSDRLPPEAAGPVRLRFFVTKAELYSFWTE
jgi:hypothetical protein